MPKPEIYPVKWLQRADRPTGDALAKYAVEKKITRSEAVRCILKAAFGIKE